MIQPLRTDRLMLYAPNRRFAPDLFVYGSDPYFCAPINAVPMREVAEAEAFLSSLSEANTNRTRCYWVAVRKVDDKAIGTLGFILGDNPELGYGFAPETWGTGLFQEAAQAVLTHGFKQLSLSRVFVVTRAENTRAVRAVEKLGFVVTRILPGRYDWNGAVKDGIELVLNA